MNDSVTIPEEENRLLGELQKEINQRYSHKPEAYRERVFFAYTIIDLLYESLRLSLDIHREGGIVRSGKNGKTKTIFPLDTRTQYDDFERHRNQTIEMLAVLKSMKNFLKTLEKDDKTPLENKLVKITTMLNSLRNYEYVIKNSEDEKITPLILSEQHTAFARRAKFSKDDLRLLLKYGSTRTERVLDLLKDRFSDFSRIEKSPPNQGPDRPFFIKQAPPNLEEDLMCLLNDMATTFPYPLEVKIKHVRPISIGNTRALHEFFETAERFDSFLVHTFHRTYTDEFTTRKNEYDRIRDMLTRRSVFSDIVTLGIGSSHGVLSLLTSEPSWIRRLIAPVQLTSEVLITYYLLGILLGYNEGEREMDTHPIIERLLEFPERKGVHYLGISGDTIGVLV